MAGPVLGLTHEELVILLRMAADTSGHPLTREEGRFLKKVMRDCKIDSEKEGVFVF